MLRYTGSFLTSEIPRLARNLYTFWNKTLADPKSSVFGSEAALFQRTLMSVSCALFLHEGVESVADARQIFSEFYYTVPHRRANYVKTVTPSEALQCLILGAVRAHAWSQPNAEFEDAKEDLKSHMRHLYDDVDTRNAIPSLKNAENPGAAFDALLEKEWKTSQEAWAELGKKPNLKKDRLQKLFEGGGDESE